MKNEPAFPSFDRGHIGGGLYWNDGDETRVEAASNNDKSCL